MFNKLENENQYGVIVRGKGIIQTLEGDWCQYDYVPGETAFRKTSAGDTGKIVFIGKNLNQPALQALLKSISHG